jgi:hypothetical protein
MSYQAEWLATPIVFGVVLIPLIAPPFALIAVAVLALAVLATLVAFAAVVLATPYLLVRSFRRHFAEPRPSTEASAAVAHLHMAALAKDPS